MVFSFICAVIILSIAPPPAGEAQNTSGVVMPPVQKQKSEKELQNEQLKKISEQNQQLIQQLSTQVPKPEIRYVYRYRTRTRTDTVYVPADEAKINPNEYFEQPCDTVYKHDTIYKTKIIRRPLIKM